METNNDILFDRLVDGELSTAERSELLASLDTRPDGWRRCALAFLEAQAWGKEMPRLVAEAASPSVAPATIVASSERSWSINWYTLAASLFIAFSLGLALRDLPHSHQTGAPNPSNIVSQSARPVSASPQLAVAGSPASDDTMTLWVRDVTGNPRQLQVPLVDASAIDKHLGLEFQTGLPDDVRHELQQQGYNVQSKRSYAPFVLENGRPLVVPVEDTKIVPVSNRVY